MLKHRVVPCLLLKNEGLVKTKRFKDPVYVGDPINAVRIFNDKEVDELIILDISASKENKPPNYTLIEEVATECFIPLCYGGGISSIEQAQKLFTIGIEKICLQSSVLTDLSLITNISKKFGSQSVVVAVDVKETWLGKKKLYSSKLGKTLNVSLLEYIKSVVEAGAGEVLINFVDREGVMQGLDLALIEQIRAELSIPLIFMGGVGSLNHIKEAVVAGASAVAAGSFFVFQGPHRAVLITYPKYRELEMLLKEVK